jgi:hypothetical protein
MIGRHASARLPLVGAACAVIACHGDLPRPERSSIADDVHAIAAARGATIALRGCAFVGESRVSDCEADLSLAQIEQLRQALVMGPLGSTPAPGPPFGKSRCLDAAAAGSLALVTGFPWIANSHYRYLLIVVPKEGGKACVETEEGYG